jgi:death on curing protein
MIPERWAILINPERILALHQEGARRYGGDPTQRAQDIDCVDGSIGAAANAASYHPEGDEDAGLILATYLIYYLAKNHCFVDGNKRVAWLSMIEVLKNLQLTVNTTEEEAYGFMLDISQGNVRSGEEVAIWLAERLEAAEGIEPVN